MRMLWPRLTWQGDPSGNSIYLTFDDGPDPEATPFVLDLLRQHGIKATFFCLGSQVEQYPGIYRRIREEGHAIGNHSHTHPNGWKTPNEEYVEDIRRAAFFIDSSLFRPPYGRIRAAQVKQIPDALNRADAEVIMWSVLSGDFDRGRSVEDCIWPVKRYTRAGSIIVFHDSRQAFPNLRGSLPVVIEFLKEKNFRFGLFSRR